MKRLNIFVLLLLVSTVASSAHSKEWARKMFETSEHDFGTVARGAKAEYEFVLQNIYKEDVHIAGVRSSCGCTTPTVTKATLRTWEKGSIKAKFNSRSFLGKKSATITVIIDKPFPAEIQLTVNGYIRSDVVLHPGAVDLGEVDAGSSAERVIDVNYAGRDTWKIVGVEAPSKHVEIKVRETRRGEGRVAYKMRVRLKPGAKAGFLNDQFYIVTNDKQMQKIPVMMKGHILPSITISPSSLALGVLDPGQRVTKQILVRSKNPFQVKGVACDGDCLSFVNPAGVKKLHVIPVTFTAGDEPGTLAMKIKVTTDSGTEAHCLATASVREPADG